MGGKAFKDGTRKVTKEEVRSTVTWLMSVWSDWSLNPALNLHQCLLGSAGKVDESGDIDINLEITAYDQKKVASQMIALLGEDNVKPRPGNNQIFMSVPIGGDQELGRVQVDLMFGDFSWQHFSYFGAERSPNCIWNNRKSSYFKGLYRTELIKAVTAFCSDWVLEENGEVIARVGPTFFHDKGLVWRYRHRPMRKDGTARVKDFKEETKEDFLKIYPSAIPAITDVIKEPKKAVEFLFDKFYSPADCETLESLAWVINRSFSSEDNRTIMKIYLERLNNLKVEIPKQAFQNIYMKV